MTIAVLAKPHNIQHEIGLINRPNNSRLQQEQFLKFFFLKQMGEKYYISNHQGEIITGSQVFSFVILRLLQEIPNQNNDHFQLRISQGGHFPISGKAESVAAAGDIYINNQGEIEKITDQSGSFYTPITDPDFALKRKSALQAMELLGLPTNLFVPFSANTALTFSSCLKQAHPFLSPVSHQDTAAKPLEHEHSRLRLDNSRVRL